MRIFNSQFFLFITLALSFSQVALGSSGRAAKQFILKETIIKAIRSKCPQDSEPIKRGLQWGMKELKREAMPTLRFDQAQVASDPNLVEAYAEYYCQTKVIPKKGELPNPAVISSYLNTPTIEEVRRRMTLNFYVTLTCLLLGARSNSEFVRGRF